jgi:hypothetical protein
MGGDLTSVCDELCSTGGSHSLTSVKALLIYQTIKKTDRPKPTTEVWAFVQFDEPGKQEWSYASILR